MQWIQTALSLSFLTYTRKKGSSRCPEDSKIIAQELKFNVEPNVNSAVVQQNYSPILSDALRMQMAPFPGVSM